MSSMPLRLICPAQKRTRFAQGQTRSPTRPACGTWAWNFSFGGALVEWSCPSRNHIGAYTRHAIRRSWVAPTRRIMTNPGLKSVPIKAVTSYAFAGDADKALAAGYNGHVSRPYRPRDSLGKSFPIWRKSSKVAFAHVAAQSHCTGCHSWHSKACSVQPARSIPNTGTSPIYYGREGKCNAPVELSRVRAERSDKT